MKFESNYFEKETRCGFEIPVMMKRAWAAKLKVLQVVIDICSRNEIQYYADWGTLLGAVRHKGYIPWDDDIDICMKRPDYQRLIDILPSQLPAGYSIKGIHAPVLSGVHAYDDIWQLCVVAERCLWDYNEFIRSFYGYPFDLVGIDIFPLDYVPRDRELYEVQKTLIDIAYVLVMQWDSLGEKGERKRLLRQFEELTGASLPDEHTRAHIFKVMDAIASLYHEEESDRLIDYGWLEKYKNYGIRKECYDDVKYVPFENIEIAIPCGWNEILTEYWGDYMQPVRMTGHAYPFYKEMEEKLSKELAEAGSTCSIDEFCEKVLSGEITCV